MNPQPPQHRTEQDFLGPYLLDASVLYGVHTARALENFPLAGQSVHPRITRGMGAIKLAAALTNRGLGAWGDDPAKADAIIRACTEMAEGLLAEHVVVDALQGGAGTSTNMNVNEVIANRALALLGLPPGEYQRVSPLDDINLHQSTNDTFPTAVRIAAIGMLGELEARIVALQESFQTAEKRFAHVVKVARTQLQDAVLITLGREMAAYAEAINRDRWRIYKCVERLRVVNLGGTAVGTGMAAPRDYIFCVVDTLRDVTRLNLARAENLVDATQNADVFVEVSGILKAHAASLLKICADLRLLASGPEAGLGEIRLPPRQAGSSLMPGKVNPVIPEAVSQVAMVVIGNDATITLAAASGSLELNPFLPVIAHRLLESIGLLTAANDILRRLCVDGIEADEARCASHMHDSTATVTALVPVIGYEAACRVAEHAARERVSIRAAALALGMLTPQDFDALVTAEAVCRLGSPDPFSTRRERP